jgi:hypothetical protein
MNSWVFRKNIMRLSIIRVLYFFRDFCNTGSDSKIGLCQGGLLSLSQAKPAPKQLNLTKLSDGGGLKDKIKPTQAEPIFNHERYRCQKYEPRP